MANKLVNKNGEAGELSSEASELSSNR